METVEQLCKQSARLASESGTPELAFKKHKKKNPEFTYEIHAGEWRW